MPTHTLSELAERLGARLEGPGELTIEGVASLNRAGPSDLSFVTDARAARLAEDSRAGALLVPESSPPIGTTALLRHPRPNVAFGEAAVLFAPPAPTYAPGVHPTAVVDPDAEVDPAAHVGPLCTVAAGARIGAGAVLVSHVAVGPSAEVGERTVLHPHVTIYAHCSVGAGCLLHAGVVIGGDGFGFEPGPEGWSKIPQVGLAVIEDDVEIGANTTVDRARFGVTRVGRGTKLDNLVMVSHNSEIGDHGLLCGQAGMAGSTRLEPWVVLGAQSGVGGHLRLVSGVRVGGGSGVITSIEEPGEYLGFPARPVARARRDWVVADVVERLRTRLARLERRLAQSSTAPSSRAPSSSAQPDAEDDPT